MTAAGVEGEKAHYTRAQQTHICFITPRLQHWMHNNISCVKPFLFLLYFFLISSSHSASVSALLLLLPLWLISLLSYLSHPCFPFWFLVLSVEPALLLHLLGPLCQRRCWEWQSEDIRWEKQELQNVESVLQNKPWQSDENPNTNLRGLLLSCMGIFLWKWMTESK